MGNLDISNDFLDTIGSANSLIEAGKYLVNGDIDSFNDWAAGEISGAFISKIPGANYIQLGFSDNARVAVFSADLESAYGVNYQDAAAFVSSAYSAIEAERSSFVAIATSQYEAGNITASELRSIRAAADQWKSIQLVLTNNTINELADSNIELFNFISSNIASGEAQIGHFQPDLEDFNTSHCFGPEVPIDMWPLDPEFAPDPSNPNKVFDQDAVRAKIWKKPIAMIRKGDTVVSFDKNDNLMPGTVTRTFENESKILLDYFGTRVPPGHVYFRPDSKKADKFECLLDILRDDGMIQNVEGRNIRTATNVPVGNPRDRHRSLLCRRC